MRTIERNYRDIITDLANQFVCAGLELSDGFGHHHEAAGSTQAAVRYGQLLRNLGVSVALSIISISAGSIAWSADDPLRAVLQSRYAAMKTAMAAHDGAAIAAILAPDFASIDVTGQSESAAQMITEVNALKPDPNKSSETTLISVVQAASAVTVEQRYDMKTVKTAADGTRHNIELITRSTDTGSSPRTFG